MARNPQLNRHGELQHLLTTEGLPREDDSLKGKVLKFRGRHAI